MTNYALQLKSAYNFTMRAGAILGYSYKNAVVLGLLDFESARALQDIAPIHAQIYSQLPPGTPRDATQLTYVKVRTSTGETRVFAMDWIAEQPTLVTSQSFTVLVHNVSAGDQARLRQALLANGFNSFEIS